MDRADYAQNDPEISSESRRESVFGSRPPTVGNKHKSSISVLPIPNELDWKVAWTIYLMLRLRTPCIFWGGFWNKLYKLLFLLNKRAKRVIIWKVMIIHTCDAVNWLKNLSIISFLKSSKISSMSASFALWATFIFVLFLKHSYCSQRYNSVGRDAAVNSKNYYRP